MLRILYNYGLCNKDFRVKENEIKRSATNGHEDIARIEGSINTNYSGKNV